jgi:hypothetical protein
MSLSTTARTAPAALPRQMPHGVRMYLGKPATVLIQLGITLAILSCARAASVDDSLGDQAALQTVYKAPASGLRTTVREVVKDPATWRALWRSVSGYGKSQPEPPRVDFTSSMLLLAAGPPLGAGDSVIITQAVEDQDGFRAVVMAYRQCAPADVITAPVHVVRVPRSEGRVRFQEDSTNAPHCPR